VYYGWDLRRATLRALRNPDLTLSVATVDDRAELEALVASTFDGYRCHYHANPLFDDARILEGYMEWALGYVLDAAPGKTTWVARRDGRIVAFACCSDDGTVGEGVLYGVHPAHAGGGLYSDLIRHTQRVFAEAGRATMRVSTQVWNYAVQKVWSREGFWLSEALDTWHVNTLLSAGETLHDAPLRFSQAQVERFAAATGDRNPLHLDAGHARDAGFEGALSHGMLAGGELSRLFGMQVPGPGTLFLRASMAFLHPVYTGRPHRLVVRALPQPEGRPRLAVATVTDESGRTCLLAYCDLLRKPG